MSGIQDMLDEIRGMGISLTPVGHRIKASGPLARLDPELKRRIQEHRLEIVEHLEGENLPRERALPLSNIQQRMHLGAGASVGADHVRSVFDVEGEIDAELIASAAQATIQQHPMLRSRFISDQNDIRQVLGPVQMVRLERMEVASGENADAVIREFVERPFMLASDQLFRLGMVVSPQSDVRRLVVVVHHALADGQSAGILMAEMARNYNLLRNGMLPKISANQGEVLDQVELFQRKSSQWEESELNEWVDAIGVDSTGTLPPCDEEALPPNQLEFGLMSQFLDAECSERFNELMVRHSCSLLATGLAATCVFLQKATGNNRIVLGLAVSERRNPLLEDAISNLAIDIPVNIEVDPGSDFVELIRACQRQILTGIERPGVPMEALLERGCLHATGRRRLRLPFAIATYDRRDISQDFEGAILSRVENSHPNPFLAMGIRLINGNDALQLNLEWDRTTFTDERARRIAGAVLELLGQLTLEPNRPIAEFGIDDSLKEGTTLERTMSAGQATGASQRPSSILDTHVASIWSDLLNVHPVEMTDRFFALGGNSLQLVRMIDRIEQTIGIRIGIEAPSGTRRSRRSSDCFRAARANSRSLLPCG